MKGYFQHIALKYDDTVCRTMKEFCNEKKRLTQQQERLKFLLACRSYGITPNHTRFTTTKVTHLFECNTIKMQLTNIEKNFHKKILNLEISQTNINITISKKKIHQIELGLISMLSTEDYTSFNKKQNERTKGIAKNVRETQQRKLHALKKIQFERYGLICNDHWFENKTHVEFPTEYKWLLSLGKKFAIPVSTNSFSALHTIADIEQCIQALEDEDEKEICRAKMANRVTGYKRNIRTTDKEKFILTIFDKTKMFLSKHKDIIIIQADKGNKTVAMYKEEYKEKMEKMLEDKNTYKTLRIDPTSKLQRTNNMIVIDLYKNEYIDAWNKKQMYCSAATAPRIYGLPKIHKANTPLRPIVSSMNVPCYHLSKHIGKILRHLVSDTTNIKNSYQLKDILQDIHLEDNEIIVSFDVISLFTNIPVHTAIQLIMKKWEIIKTHTHIPRNTFLEILKFCLQDNNYFIYDGKIYNQIFGMPMGNPLSPTIADIVLDDLLEDTMANLKQNDINIKYIFKYVDDILAIIKKDDAEEILSKLNCYHPKIQFTMESECENQIAYLDTKLHHIGNSIKFDWHAKSTSSGRIMNFNATQPKSQIINTAKSMIQRILTISDDQYHTKNTKEIIEILTNNSFPKKLTLQLIDETKRIIKTRKNKQTTLNTDSNTDRIFHGVKYIPGLIDNKNLRTTMTTKNICFAYKPNRTLSAIFSNTKHPIEKQQQCNVVYEIACKGDGNESCDRVYIGTTKRMLQTRMNEHKIDIEKKKEKTALSQHIANTGHTADFDDVRILDRERKEKKRLTIESLRIQQKIERTMNVKEDTDNISSSYSVVIS